MNIGPTVQWFWRKFQSLKEKIILINCTFVTRFVEIGLTSGSGEDVERMQIDMQSSET